MSVNPGISIVTVVLFPVPLVVQVPLSVLLLHVTETVLSSEKLKS
ncbi:hypothetical protein [Winogradskyella undariae]|nr:hypothetical protein [Winogradskyella undariae]